MSGEDEGEGAKKKKEGEGEEAAAAYSMSCVLALYKLYVVHTRIYEFGLFCIVIAISRSRVLFEQWDDLDAQ